MDEAEGNELENKTVIKCSTCIYRHLAFTAESQCFGKDGEFNFSFCNYQKENQ